MRAQVCNDASLTLPEGAHQVPNQGEESREETEAGGRCVLEGGGPWAEHRVSPSQLDACNQETGPFLLWPDPFASVKKASIRCDQGLEVQGVMTFLGIFLEEIKRLDMVMEDHLRNSINLQKRNEVDPPRRIRLISSLSRAPGQRSSVLTGMGETSRGPWAPTGEYRPAKEEWGKLARLLLWGLVFRPVLTPGAHTGHPQDSGTPTAASWSLYS
ncbi:uncharacterized protein LOC129145967 isoform X3 [Talpa occidentalis]|uniref:uncharacterized protein LOC129145967 isoform X3 n=1 Tax=Talpa occidentalis TaxID=50954 RepID=UPI0023F9E5DF|nr:uncharacterized protein LOC129145967 isoform X3 [Talpa occidentalis]